MPEDSQIKQLKSSLQSALSPEVFAEISAILDEIAQEEKSQQIVGPADSAVYANKEGPWSAYEMSLQRPTRDASPPMGEITRAGGDFTGGAYGLPRPLAEISWDHLEQMQDHYLIALCLAVRGLPLYLIFRNEPGDGWDIEVADENEQVRDLVRAVIKRIIHRLIREALTALFYGFYAGEKVWERASADALGLEGMSGDLFIYSKVKGSHPRTVTLLRDDVTDQFDGYEQSTGALNVRVPPEKSFVYSFRKKFGNLYGEPLAKKLFTPWWNLEFTWRALMRYLERHGTPVAVCYAPQGENLKDSSGTIKDAMDIGLNVALDIARSTAAVLPSQNFLPDEGGGPKWRLEYLADSGYAAQFDTVIDRHETALIRSAEIPEKSIGQQGEGSGAYAAWKVPTDLLRQTLERDLMEFAEHVNAYLLPDLGRYNFGERYAVPGMISLSFQGMDTSEMERLATLMASFASHEDAKYVDFLKMAQQAGVPVLDEEEIARRRQEADSRREQMREQMQARGEAEDVEATPARAMTNEEMIRYFSAQQFKTDGHITLRAASPEEFQAKAKLLAEAGVPDYWPVQCEWEEEADPDDSAPVVESEATS